MTGNTEAQSTPPPVSPALALWLALAAWRQQPGPLIAAIVAISMGVALGLGIDLVNRSALDEFDKAISQVNGQAQYRVQSASPQLSDQILSAVEQDPAVAAASPVIETDVRLAVPIPAHTDPLLSRPAKLKVIGIDVFRAARVTPALLPSAGASSPGGASSSVFSDDAIFLSAGAQRLLTANDLASEAGTPLAIQVNGRTRDLIISGSVPGATGSAPLAVMDIGAAQWRLAWLGQLSRIDLRLVNGADALALQARLQQIDPSLRLARPDDQARQMSNLSRAYRVNLSVLALVALLTGGFIVFASMELAVVRMLPMLALVGVLGAPARWRPMLVLGMALALGLVGAAFGVALGIALAWGLLGLVGADLGGGYFSATRPTLSIPFEALALFSSLGVLAAVLGAFSPAMKLRKLAPAQTLKHGQATSLPDHLAPLKVSLTLALVGTVLLMLPAIGGLPLGAYLAIACWLFAGVLIIAPLLGVVARLLTRWRYRRSGALAWLAVSRLDGAHQSAFPALAGVVASFALVCAMAIMVHSFRISVDNWLETVLPADLYLSVPTTGASAGLTPENQQTLAALPGVKQVTFLRSIDLNLDPDRPALAVLARPIDSDDPGRSLPLTGAWLSPEDRGSTCTAIHISEPAATLYNWNLGDEISLPIGVANSGKQPCFEVISIWRDYARQHGAVTLDRDDYQALTNDTSVSNAAISLAEGADANEVLARARAALDGISGLQARSSQAIRALSLKIFDRSFAVTYALEAVALLVGLFGVATTYSGEALARAREFGMLRHLGVTRSDLARLFATESLVAIGLGLVWGACLGGLISQILIHRVNPQSFHWTMQTHLPLNLLAGGALALLTLGVGTAIIAARQAAGRAPIAAVRADW